MSGLSDCWLYPTVSSVPRTTRVNPFKGLLHSGSLPQTRVVALRWRGDRALRIFVDPVSRLGDRDAVPAGSLCDLPPGLDVDGNAIFLAPRALASLRFAGDQNFLEPGSQCTAPHVFDELLYVCHKLRAAPQLLDINHDGEEAVAHAVSIWTAASGSRERPGQNVAHEAEREALVAPHREQGSLRRPIESSGGYRRLTFRVKDTALWDRISAM